MPPPRVLIIVFFCTKTVVKTIKSNDEGKHRANQEGDLGVTV